MRVAAVGSENGFSGELYAGNLVALLVVLVRPHILADCGGQSVEGGKLQPFCPLFITRVCVELFVRIHKLRNRAKLRALYRA